MPRKFGGNSPLGSALNEAGSKQEGLRVRRVSYKTGQIVAFGYESSNEDGKKTAQPTTDPRLPGLYIFSVKLSDGTITGLLPLVGKALDHAGNKGRPNDLLGEFCLIVFEGPTINNGRILNIVDDKSDTDKVARSNEVPITGAAFAPPGSGLI